MLELKSLSLSKEKIPTLAVPVCEDKAIHAGALAKLVTQAEKIEEFDGKSDEVLTLYRPAGTRTERVLFMGLGKQAELSSEKLRSFAGKAVTAAIKNNLGEIAIAAPDRKKIAASGADMVTALLEGACLGNHVFDRYKKEKEHRPLKNISLLVTAERAKKYAELPKRIQSICEGTLLARDWISTPSNDKTPARLARAFVSLGRKVQLKTNVLSLKQLRQGKFGALLAVAAGSDNTPRMATLEYAPKNWEKTLVLVGKGVTFDSGGINLKPTSGLADMKVDMSGAAAVAATLVTVAKIKPRVRVVGVMPLVENMVSGRATRPGDIVTSHAGKTVEIGNTDAEGRLILIDAMSYALQEFKPDVMVDIATLTGACVVALGERIAGLFTADDALAETLLTAGEKTHERLWRMPLPDDYRKLMKSEFADINNMSSTRWGGAITAALFLSEFAAGTRWAHIDIAGPAYRKKASDYCPAGGTGFGVRLLCDLIANWQSD